MQKIINKFRNNTLVKGSFLLTIGGLIANIGNYAFHLIMGRLLTPEMYGTLAALTSLTIIVSLPSSIISTVTTKFIAEFEARREYGKTIRLISKMNLYTMLGGLSLLLGFIVFNSYIQNYLKIYDSRLITITGFVVVMGLVSSVQQGVYRGLLLFKLMIGLTLFGIVLKLVFGWYFVIIGYSVLGILVAFFISGLIPWLVALIPIRTYIFTPSKSVAGLRKEVLIFSLPAFLITAATTLLSSVDLIMVKHFFSGEEAGLYAASSLIGKSLYYAFLPVSTVLFSVSVQRFATGKKLLSEFIFGLTFTLLPGIFVLLLYSSFPDLIVRIFFPSVLYSEASHLIVPYGIFMLLYLILNMFINMLLAIGNYRYSWILLFGALTQILLIACFHSSLSQVIFVSIITVAGILVISFYELVRLKIL